MADMPAGEGGGVQRSGGNNNATADNINTSRLSDEVGSTCNEASLLSPQQRQFHPQHLPKQIRPISGSLQVTGTSRTIRGSDVVGASRDRAIKPRISTTTQTGAIVQSPPSPHSTSSSLSFGGTAASTITEPPRNIGTGPSAPGGVDHKRSRACESCRGLKVRCEPANEANLQGSCKRCAKAGRHCIFTVPSRKRQKRTDSKVAELEKKIDALTASLQAVKERGGNSRSPTPVQDLEYDDDNDDESHGNEDERMENCSPEGDIRAMDWRPASVAMYALTDTTNRTVKSETASPVLKRHREGDDVDIEASSQTETSDAKSDSIPTKAIPTMTSSPHRSQREAGSKTKPYQDVIDRGLLGMDLATDIFNRYVNEMAPLFPIVVFPPKTTAAQVRKSTPQLFLAILAIASGPTSPELHAELHEECLQELADRVMCRGEKSLGLIQVALLISVWYYPPNYAEELRFYQLIHIAAVMAIELGLTNKAVHLKNAHTGFWSMDMTRLPKHQSKGQSLASKMARPPHPDSTAMESRRTLLACYWCCSSVSSSLRRPNIFRFTSYMGECIDILEKSPEALPSDKILAQWCKLQRITEEATIAFGLDDPGVNVSIQDPRTQFAYRGFSRQLEQFKEQASQVGIMGKSLELSYQFSLLSINEIALQAEHNVDESSSPFPVNMVRNSTPLLSSAGSNSILSSFHIGMLAKCLVATYTILDTFLSFSIEELRALPVFHFVRTVYASFILLKLFFSASAPMSELGKVIDTESLKVDMYLEKTVQRMKEAGAKSRAAMKFGIIMTLLKNWWELQKDDGKKKKGDMEGGGNSRKDEDGGKPPSGRESRESVMPENEDGGSGDSGKVNLPANQINCHTRTEEQYSRRQECDFGTISSYETSPDTPHFTASSAPTPTTAESAGTPRSTDNPTQVQQNPHPYPPQQYPLYHQPTTPLQILSDVASRGAVNRRNHTPDPSKPLSSSRTSFSLQQHHKQQQPYRQPHHLQQHQRQQHSYQQPRHQYSEPGYPEHHQHHHQPLQPQHQHPQPLSPPPPPPPPLSSNPQQYGYPLPTSDSTGVTMPFEEGIFPGNLQSNVYPFSLTSRGANDPSSYFAPTTTTTSSPTTAPPQDVNMTNIEIDANMVGMIEMMPIGLGGGWMINDLLWAMIDGGLQMPIQGWPEDGGGGSPEGGAGGGG